MSRTYIAAFIAALVANGAGPASAINDTAGTAGVNFLQIGPPRHYKTDRRFPRIALTYQKLGIFRQTFPDPPGIDGSGTRAGPAWGRDRPGG